MNNLSEVGLIRLELIGALWDDLSDEEKRGAASKLADIVAFLGH